MCWICKPQLFKLQVAQEDVPVYKVVRGLAEHIVAWYVPYIYNKAFAVTQHSEVSFTTGHDGYIIGNKGFHAYEIMPYLYGEGILAGTIYREKFNAIPLVVKCHIPKGALYATNGVETISSAIKFDTFISAKALMFFPGTEQDQEFIERYEKARERAKNIIDGIKNE